MSQNIPFRHTALIIILLAGVQFILQVSLLAKGMEYVAVSLIIDDTYYYLQTAWNTKTLGFVTFDGLHTTNGVQLLWFFIIFLLATLSNSKAILLFTTLTASFLLNGLCYLIIIKIGAILKQPVLALIMAGLWALQSLPFRIYSMGMENSLHALLFWCVIWQSLEFLIRIQNNDQPNFWGLTLVLILLVWTRLDSAILSALFFTFSVGMLAYSHRNDKGLFLRRHSKAILGSCILASFGLITQLTAFQLMGNSILPVSALIKTSGAGQSLDIEPLNKLGEAFLLGMPSILQGRFPALLLVLLGITGILLIIVASIAIHDLSDEVRAFLNLWSCILVGEIIYHGAVALSGVHYTPYFIWYRSPSFIFWIITGSLLTLFTFVQIRRIKLPFNILKWAPVGLSLAMYGVAIYMFARSMNFTSKLYVARYNAALWIAENSHPDTIFASWNAGQLGFFSDRTFINLDGLINSVDYYERVLTGSTSLAEYLVENNVEFIVDYDTYGAIPDFPVVHTFPLNDGSGRSIQLWRVSPLLLSSP